MTDARFRNAAVVGTGMMGPGIAVTLAQGGVRTKLVSRTAEGAAAGLEKARALARLLETEQLADSGSANRVAALVSATADFESAVAPADLVIESAPEDMQFKQDLFARMDALARPGAVLASNTSGLSITAIAARCRFPERVLTTHFWNPPHLVPLVEVVKGEKTSDEAALAIHSLLAACGKVPVLVRKDRPGQLGNRLQMALVREAINIVQEGIADAEDVDTASKCGFGMRLPVYGILEHMDAVGLDFSMSVLDYVSRDLSDVKGTPPLARDLIARGDLGPKTGHGFHDWTRKDIVQVRARRDQFLIEFLRAERVRRKRT
jgi:3-hydroxybutyryl-CoA dehydrogenase